MAAGNYHRTDAQGAELIPNPLGDDGAYVFALPPPPSASMAPFGQAPMTSAGPTPTTALSTGMSPAVKMVIGIIVALVLLWIVSELMKRFQPVSRNPARQQLSTSELASMLHSRLERRGDADPEVLRSLAAYARR
jgi:hypothetical protein